MRNKILVWAAVPFLAACGNESQKQTKEKTKEGPVAFAVSNVDSSIQPCDDFFEYAIGNWVKDNPIPSTESRWSGFDELVRKNEDKLLGLIKGTLDKKDPPKGSDNQLIADFYRASMDADHLQKVGISPLKPWFDAVDQAKSKAELFKLMAANKRYGVGTPVAFYVGTNSKNSNEHIAYLSQSGLNLPDREYYLKEDEKSIEIREKYVAFVNDLFTLAEMNQQPGETILKMETELSKGHWARVQLRDPDKTYNKKSLAGFDAELAELNIQDFVATCGLSNIDSVVVSTPSYYTHLNNWFNTQSLADLKTYYNWQIINSYASFINDEFEQKNFEFYAGVLRGVKEMKPREERMMRRVNGMLGEPLGRLFVAAHFPEESKAYIEEMIENLRSAYRDRIKTLSWMSEETKVKALEKLNAFNYKVGYPEEYKKDFSELTIQADAQIENVMTLRSFGYDWMITKIDQPVDKGEWGMTPQTVNAYYSATKNEIVFPAGILQPPFFHPNFDHAINYGGIGGVIGHEFTHGFDDQGSKFDAKGNLNNWWTAEDRERFDVLANKLAAQYQSYIPVDTMHINGKLTLGENIADLGGITLAFEALKKKVGEDKPAPIDGYTWEQRFFLGWANVWKGSLTEEETKRRIMTDPHSPMKYRVLGPLANSSNFEHAFGCNHGKMVKPDSTKIVIW